MRVLVVALVLGAAFAAFQLASLESKPTQEQVNPRVVHLNDSSLSAIAEKVLPAAGFTSRIRWGDVIPRLISLGVIDEQKFASAVQLGSEERAVLDGSYSGRIHVNSTSSWFTVTVLWPLGLANKNPILENNGMAGPDLDNYAATGGWSLGNADSGGGYYNRYELIKLTSEQQAVAEYVADRVFRPCCNAPTSFPDCNHGAAMLGLIQLGASQGLTKEQLFEEALHFNSFWFAQSYVETAIYFEVAKGVSWENVDPETIVGRDYSSASGYVRTARALAQLNISLSGAGGSSCSA